MNYHNTTNEGGEQLEPEQFLVEVKSLTLEYSLSELF